MGTKAKGQLEAILTGYQVLFAEKDTDLDPGSIATGSPPNIQQWPYRTLFAHQPLIDEHITVILAANIISPSSFPWNSAIVIVPN